MPRAKSNRSRAEAAAHQLLAGILCGDYPLHHKLPPERLLCGQIGTNRTVLRAALKQLSDDGVIWQHIGKGSYVGGSPCSIATPAEKLGTATSLSEMLECRLAIEPGVCELAALRCDAKAVSMIELYHRKSATATDWAQFDRWDDLFHRAIAEASGNGMLIGLIDSVFRAKRSSPWNIMRSKQFDADLLMRYARDHAKVVFHIKRKNPRGARDAMRDHILDIQATLGPHLS